MLLESSKANITQVFSSSMSLVSLMLALLCSNNIDHIKWVRGSTLDRLIDVEKHFVKIKITISSKIHIPNILIFLYKCSVQHLFYGCSYLNRMIVILIYAPKNTNISKLRGIALHFLFWQNCYTYEYFDNLNYLRRVLMIHSFIYTCKYKNEYFIK